MTDDELNALMAEMDRKASQAFDADARRSSEAEPAPAPSARTPSMMVRDTMRANSFDDAAEGGPEEPVETETVQHLDAGTATEAAMPAEDENSAEDMAADTGFDDIDEPQVEETTDEHASDIADDDMPHADFADEAGDADVDDLEEDVQTRESLRIDRSNAAEDEAAAEEKPSLRLKKPESPAADDAPEAADDAGERRVSLRVERPRTSHSISKRREDVAPDAVARKDSGARKPRVMLMGEFSAGKSTLMNLLLGEPALPTNTTATQLPPVWISKGSDDQPMRVDVEGFEEPVDLASPDIPLSDTHYIRLEKQADLLDLCDLIDTPGISDPNMPAEIWQRMLQHADIVIWCTHATQAWRQSEAAAWSMMPQKLQKRSLLLLTRFDKVASDRDRIRVLKRVRSETEGLFRDIFPIALTDAIAAGDDKDAFAAAGGESFADALFEVIGLIQRKDQSVQTRPRSQIAPFKLEPEPEPVRVVTPRRVRPRPLTARPLGRRPDDLHDGH